MRAMLRFLPLLIGVLLLPLFVARIGLQSIIAELHQLGPQVLWILAPYAAGTALSAAPWAWLLPQQLRPGRGQTVAGRFAASGANALLPFFGLAGEPCRLLWLDRSARAEGLAAIVIDRLLYNAAGGVLLLVAAAAARSTPLPVQLVVAGIGAALLIIALSAFTLHAITRWRIGRGVERVLRRILGSAVRESALGEQVDAALRQMARQRSRVLLPAQVQHCLARAVMCVEVYVVLRGLHAPATLAHVLVLSSVPVATSVFASAIPSQIGVQEGAQALVCGALGLDPALGLVLVLLQRARQLAFVPLTLVLLGAARSSAAASPAVVGTVNSESQPWPPRAEQKPH
jgi:lysylphosphatidylglycerol synthase-like protein